GIFRSSANTTSMDCAPLTTWLFVTMTPSEPMTKPVPAPSPGTGFKKSPRLSVRVRMDTTAGSTLARIVWTSPVRVIFDVLDEKVSDRPEPDGLSSLTAATTSPATSAPTTAPVRAASRKGRRPTGRGGDGRGGPPRRHRGPDLPGGGRRRRRRGHRLLVDQRVDPGVGRSQRVGRLRSLRRRGLDRRRPGRGRLDGRHLHRRRRGPGGLGGRGPRRRRGRRRGGRLPRRRRRAIRRG